MKKLLIGILFLVCAASVFSTQEETTPLYLTSQALKSGLAKSFLSRQHIVILKGFYEEDLGKLGDFTNVRILDLYPAMDIREITGIPPLDTLQKLNASTRTVSDLDVEYLRHLTKG